jgi:hypothetical protein
MTIKKVKAAAMNALRENPGTAEIATTYDRLRFVDSTANLIHPGGVAGPAELSLMLYRVKNGQQPTITARDNMLSGRDVPKKIYPGGFFPPVDTPQTYSGPYAMPNVQADYGGVGNSEIPPPPNYPANAPKPQAAHISFVELDGQQVCRVL